MRKCWRTSRHADTRPISMLPAASGRGATHFGEAADWLDRTVNAESVTTRASKSRSTNCTG
jgi:hypothetical protein